MCHMEKHACLHIRCFQFLEKSMAVQNQLKMSTYFDILVTYLGEGQRYQNKAIKSGGRFIYEVFRL